MFDAADEWKYWPSTVRWARERGWLVVQDPVDGSWFSIPAKGAPRGWTQLASHEKARKGTKRPEKARKGQKS